MATIKSKPVQLPPQIIGNIGLFHVCCELSRRGLNVVPTSRNTKSVDVIVGTADFSKHATIQVKTSTINMGHPVVAIDKGKEVALQKVRLADFWIFVRLERANKHRVRAVAVCDSKDEDALESSKTYWWYNPWLSRNEAAKEKWKKDDAGWQLITDFLSEGVSR